MSQLKEAVDKSSGLIKEFREFIARGNVVDLAVAVVMGTAFNAIINSIVNDLVNPLLGIIIGGIDFTSLALTVGSASFTYGNLISAVIHFILISLVIFLLIKVINKISRKKEEAPPDTQACPYCTSDIPKAAVRCPNCTTILDEDKVPENLR
ncbi:MAG: large conductance mechanosensitive channel protein MscL [Coriobacteriales bacterium]|jgi:large conductance mechanosensitive channel|nr:large conductance mechanosensitive channel protein MscL [Coriobacteriales bacterium]